MIPENLTLPNGAAPVKTVEAEPVKAVEAEKPAEPCKPSKILVIDIGGTKLKLLASGATEPRKAPSGKKMTPANMVEVVRELAGEWEFEAVSMGLPCLVGDHGPRSE